MPAGPAAGASHAPNLDCDALPCAAVLPEARVFAPHPSLPIFEGKSASGDVVGWVARSDDLVATLGYSNKPISTLVGVSPSGTIEGVRVIQHSEPILLVGIPEQRFFDFVSHYRGLPADARVVIGKAKDPDVVTIDAISGATVTCLAENQTIMETARAVGAGVGILEASRAVPGHFARDDRPRTWEELIEAGVFGRLTVTQKDMGLPADRDGTPFVDLFFTFADPPWVGRSLLGDAVYTHEMAATPKAHLLVIFGWGTSSFKGSGFVRGGTFDRVRLEQGLKSITFSDWDYRNVPEAVADGAPAFKEGALFRVKPSDIDPGQPFTLTFLGSRYDKRTAFSRSFQSFQATHRLPSSMYVLDGPSPENQLLAQAWRVGGARALMVGLIYGFVILLFAFRKRVMRDKRRLVRLHTAVMVTSFVGLGLWLRAQPSVTQILTVFDSALHGWRWALFLSEPILWVSWIAITFVSLVWGRGVFCGWLCPYGTMTELLYKVGGALGLPRYELPDRVHQKLRFVRYGVLVVLVGVFLYAPATGERLAEVEPFKTTFFVLPWTRHALLIAWWLVLLLASTMMWRPFCRYLCPLGAGLALLGSFRLSGPYRRDFCSKCKICTRGCEPKAIRPDGTIDPRECLSCMECEANYNDDDVCPPLVQIKRRKERAA